MDEICLPIDIGVEKEAETEEGGYRVGEEEGVEIIVEAIVTQN